MHYYSFILYQCVIPSIHILQLEDDDSQIQNTGNHFTEEIIAQAACEAHATRRDQFGRVYAVGKKCSRSYTCANICASSSLHAQDRLSTISGAVLQPSMFIMADHQLRKMESQTLLSLD